MTEEKHSIKYTEQLNTIGSKLTSQVTELLNEVDSYSYHYYDNNFYPQIPINDKDRIKTRKEIKKGETIFDRISESLLRNDIVMNYIENVEKFTNQFQEKIQKLKEEIENERNILTKTNNEILENLESLHRIMNRKLLKLIEDSRAG